jgi:transposase
VSAHERRDKVLALRAAGQSHVQIAVELGVSTMRIYQLIRHAKADAYDALVAEGKAPPIGERGSSNGKP